MSLIKIFTILILVNCSISEYHNLNFKNEIKPTIPLIILPLDVGGTLSVQLWNLKTVPQNEDDKFGFSIHKGEKSLTSYVLNPDKDKDDCPLNDLRTDVYPVVYFIMDLKQKQMKLRCNDAWQEHLNQFTSIANNPEEQMKASLTRNDSFQDYCSTTSFPIVSQDINGVTYFNTGFVWTIASKSQEDLYHMYFHSCPKDETKKPSYDFNIHIFDEYNADSNTYYLLCFMEPLTYYMSALHMMHALLKHKCCCILRINYLIIISLLFKGMSLNLKGIHWFLENPGYAYKFVCDFLDVILESYIIAIMLGIACGLDIIIGTLGRREKLLALIIACMQILSGIALIVSRINEHVWLVNSDWLKLHLLIDLMMWGICLIVPGFWNRRYLIELEDFELYRSLFLLALVYFYTTRIIVVMIKQISSYKYGWVGDEIKDVFTYFMFVLIEQNCRPLVTDSCIKVSIVDTDDALIDLSTDDKPISDDIKNKK